ncbi:MAG: flagellar biosynthesis anti-sigma factor FlgM [Planctomycetes bacterium]|nr:flagellar biosynthesis anti-sigma factor FlgM [Planctomycetota bacterium]
MANISGINPTSGPQPVQPNATAKQPAKPVATAQAPDTVEISEQAHLASKLAAIPDVRADLVARVRGEIAAGTYETDEKLEIAIANLLEEL